MASRPPIAPARRHPIADRKARWLARWVARSTDERLRRAMGGPVRRLLLWQIFRTMRQRFDAERAAGVDAVVEFRVGGRRDGGADVRQMWIGGGRCRVTRRRSNRPALTLELDPLAFLKLTGGATAGWRLLVGGTLRARGDLLLAMRLPRLLDVPRPGPPGG